MPVERFIDEASISRCWRPPPIAQGCNDGDDGLLVEVVRRSATVRVLTFNVLSAPHADWQQRRQVARSWLHEIRPDVAALQETTPGGGTQQVHDLLGPEYHVVEHRAQPTDTVGMVMASRWPFGTIHDIDLSVPPRVPSAWGIMAEVHLPAPFGTSWFVHHAAAFQYGYAYEREQQAIACVRVIEDQVAGSDTHVLLLGDFNDTPDSASIRFWTGSQALDGLSVCYQDAWEAAHPNELGHTFSPVNPLVPAGEMPLESGRRIDYIMIRCGSHGPSVHITDCRLVLDQHADGVWASDHFGVVAELEPSAHRPGTWTKPSPSTSRVQ